MPIPQPYLCQNIVLMGLMYCLLVESMLLAEGLAFDGHCYDVEALGNVWVYRVNNMWMYRVNMQ